MKRERIPVITINSNERRLKEAKIYLERDEEVIPHFNLVLKDGSTFKIMLEKAEYIEPIPRKLTDEEIDIVIKYLDSKCEDEYFGGRFEGYKNWHLLIFAWNNENAHAQSYIYPKKRRLNEKLPMPDYKKLKN